MTEEPTVFTTALDLVVFAPLGLVLTVGEEIPKLAAKGRARIGGRITTARMIGQFAVTQGRREVGRRWGNASQPSPTSPTSTAAARPASTPMPRSPAGTVTPGAMPPVTPAAATPTSPADAETPTSPAVAATPVAPAPSTAPSRPRGPAPSVAAAAPLTTSRLPSALPPLLAPDARPTARTGPGGSTTPAPTVGAAPEVASLAIPGYASLSASQVVQRLAGLSDEELEAVGAYEASNRGRRTILARVTQLQSR
jgi:hypothetical protein